MDYSEISETLGVKDYAANANLVPKRNLAFADARDLKDFLAR